MTRCRRPISAAQRRRLRDEMLMTRVQRARAERQQREDFDRRLNASPAYRDLQDELAHWQAKLRLVELDRAALAAQMEYVRQRHGPQPYTSEPDPSERDPV